MRNAQLLAYSPTDIKALFMNSFTLKIIIIIKQNGGFSERKKKKRETFLNFADYSRIKQMQSIV